MYIQGYAGHFSPAVREEIMKQAVIDIGSNSMRLTVYETNAGSFTVLFKDKVMAGLAGYVEEGVLSREGIARACQGLLSFQAVLEALDIRRAAVFATASLRNIKNTHQALSLLEAAAGYPIEVLSGEEEARLGYAGAMEELALSDGVFVDIGGASTEIVRFSQGTIQDAVSCPVGSLKLYRDHVKKILPNEQALVRMNRAIDLAAGEAIQKPRARSLPLVCVGGTARACLRMTRAVYGLPETVNRISARQVEDLCTLLTGSQKRAADLILKQEPDRIHTMIPGLLILRHLVEGFGAGEIVVSKYGVREGYLCKKILKVS